MAAVYAASHRSGHKVAVKILHDRLSMDADIERRFRQEALIVNRVDDPGVVPVIDNGVTQDGCWFLVMPLLEGESVQTRAVRHATGLALTEVLLIAQATLSTLEKAHQRGIVHRDIKPDNLFITYDGSIKVLDFGIARHLAADPAFHTASGHALGTPGFMSPEQALGRSRLIDGRTDLWAVGATMFTLLTGRKVHIAESAAEGVVLAGTRAVPSIADVMPELPPEIANVVDRALAFEKGARWPSATLMREELERACELVLERPLRDLPRICVSPREEVPTDVAIRLPPRWGALDAAQRDVSTRTIGTTQSFAITGAKQRTSGTTRARLRLASGVGAVVLAGSAIFGGIRWRGSHRSESMTRTLVAPMPADAEAESKNASSAAPFAATPSASTRYLGAWRTAWLDGDASRIREEAAQLLEKDPSNARAHLASVVAAHFWPDGDARTHFHRAQGLRDQLDASEVAYLEAIAPGMTVPPDFRLASERLQRLLDDRPEDTVVRMALADMKLRLDDLDGCGAVLAPFLNRPDPPGIALSRHAAIAAMRDDVETARSSYQRCLANQPGSQVCAGPLASLEMNDGRCAEAEKVLRRQISVTPDATAYRRLAYVLESQGATPEQVAPVLESWVRASPVDERGRDEVQARIDVSLMQGRLSDALAQYNDLGRLLETVADDPPHFYYTRSRMTLEAELGDQRAAAATLARYESGRTALTRDVAGEDNVTYLQAVGVEFGVVPWKTWLRERDDRLAHPNEVDGQLGGRAVAWLQHFAIPTVSPEAAGEARDALPKYGPILSRPDRNYAQDAAIARVYALGGNTDAARPYAERAAASCEALDDLVQFHRAEIELADLYARSGDAVRACTVYGSVLKRWPVSSGSASSRRASEGAKRMCRPGDGTR